MTTTATAGKTGEPAAAANADARRLRQAAARFWRTSAGHQARAVELEHSEQADRLYLARLQRDVAEVAAQHALAYQELALAVEARAAAAAQPVSSPQWTEAVHRGSSAVRRAGAHYQRAAAFAARATGRIDEARFHEQVAKHAEAAEPNF